VFLADLGKEVYGRMSRIGNESETMAGTPQCRHRDLNRRGILDVISSKLLHRTTVRYPTKDSRPVDIERLDLCGYGVAEWTCWIKAVWNCECIEHTNISGVQRSFAPIQIGMGAPERNGSYPRYQGLRDAWIIRMKAQRASAWLAVQSYERKRSLASFAVGANKRAFHESHVCIEGVRSPAASVEIGARTGEAQISFTDESAEVEDLRRVAAIRMGPGGIGWSECALHRTGKEPMQSRAKGSCGRVGNWVRQLA
jgi:hypothetical protein